MKNADPGPTFEDPWEYWRERALILDASVDRLLVCGNHIALYRTDKWPDYPLNGLTRAQQCANALERLGATQDYDMWCCWSGMMQERDALQSWFDEMSNNN